MFPILPLAMHLCGLYISQLCDDTQDVCDSSDTDSDNPQVQVNDGPSPPRRRGPPSTPLVSSLPCSKGRFLIVLLLVGNLPLALYTGLIHQRGTLDVMPFLHTETRMQPANLSMSVLTLMPCHSTPHYR